VTRCGCWSCRKRRGPRAVAPLLARAWDQDRVLDAERAHLAGELLKLNRLVAHRELQAMRAGRLGKRRYIGKRAWKLERARRDRDRVRARLEAIG
jgi:hypothetical protein